MSDEYPTALESMWQILLPATPPAAQLNSFQYSNCGYGVAGLIVDRLAGVSYEQYLADSILKPLGLSTASEFWGRIKHQM